jgi:hypothetical protein
VGVLSSTSCRRQRLNRNVFANLPRIVLSLVLPVVVVISRPVLCQDEKQLRVTVIAVTEFDDKRLAEPTLITNIKEATQELDQFFEKQFAVTPRIFSSRDETTAQALRKWLFYDVSRDTSQTINAVFILTHGIGYQYAASTQFKNELFLATSDTNSDDYFGVALRGSELVDAFERLNRGSSAFLFLDTCGSGSIYNTGIAALLATADSTRMMILAAAMPDESAYRARFTKALLSIWESPPQPAPYDCHSGDPGIPNYVNQVMNKDPVAASLHQSVSLVSPYTSDFCIESFTSEGALALIGNPTDEPVKVSVRLARDSNDVIPVQLKAHSVVPEMLRREAYTISTEPVFDTSPLKPTSVNLDLSVDFVQYVPLYSAAPYASALAKQKAAEYADEWGAPIPKIQSLWSSASADLETARAAVTSSTQSWEQSFLTEQTSVQRAQEDKEEQQNRVVLAENRLSLKEQEIRQRHSSTSDLPIVGNNTQVSNSERQELQTAQSDVEQTKAGFAKADERLRSGLAGLNEAAREKNKLEEMLTEITRAAEQASALKEDAGKKKQNRAALMSSLERFFPTHDSRRGLVVSLPAGAPAEQVSGLGKKLGSLGTNLLIEVEVYIAGEDTRKVQLEATNAATQIQQELVAGSGLPLDWTVARGLAGLPRGTKPDHRIEQIVISGESLGSMTLN